MPRLELCAHWSSASHYSPWRSTTPPTGQIQQQY
uniref:Uncharacterized protein n=1 Tax=Anguilla anguilla TaxID=7936 RepID=A0A0E9P9U6_ANGAN